VLRALIESLALPGFDFTDLAGLRQRAGQGASLSGTGLAAAPAPAAGLERIVATPIYRGDAVLRRAAALNAHPLTRGAHAALHPDDARALGLAEGAMAKVGDGVGNSALPVLLSPRIARGAIWIESGYEATAPLSPTAALDVTGA
jgi:NADH-quinone oxidoreductase subunit G